MRKLAIGLIFASAPLFAQQSLYQDASGGTSIYLSDQAGIASFNFGNSKVQAGIRKSIDREDNWRLGAEIFATAQNGIAGIIRNGIPQTGVGGDVVLTWAPSNQSGKLPGPANPGVGTIPCRLCGYWAPIDFSYQRSTLNTLPAATPPLTVQNHNFDQYALRIGLNALIKTSRSDFLLGLIAGAERRNNTDDLKTVQVSTEILQTLQNSQVTTLSQNPKSAYLGPYVKYIAAPVNFDAIWYPFTNRLIKPTSQDPQPNAGKNHFAIDIFERSNVGQRDRYIAPGLGVFVTRPGQPARPVGGVTVTYKSGKAQLALVTGWTF
ncbi:MAG: hypothetical protein M3N93_02000 [Acidobacteriota bacterium]|nr:hypothetical protein [Acidobacteriota bacterium]